jgi:hypothetical protein
MTDWYLEKGNGLLLAPKTRLLYLNAKFNMICQNRYLRLNFERLHIELDRPDHPEDRKKMGSSPASVGLEAASIPVSPA